MGAPLDLPKMVACQIPKRSNRRQKPKKLRAVKGQSADEIQYRKDLVAVAKALERLTREVIFPLLKNLEPRFLRDAVGDDINNAMTAMRAQFASLNDYAEAKASGHIQRMDKAHQRRFFKQLQKQVGVDLAGVVNREGLENVLSIQTRQNVNLITSIPEQYFSKLEQIIYSNTVTGSVSAAALQTQIRELFDVTAKRAKFIARDQTAKLNAAINTERNLSLGIEKYEWRATGGKAGDGRTRPNHRSKHEKIFRFDSPPADTGHPGQDFNCRCTARSIIPV